MKKLLLFLLLTHQILAQESLDSIPLSVSFDQEVVVTGQYSPTEVKTSTLPVRVITQEMIVKRAATNLTEVFQQEANIRIAHDPVLGTSMTMNGLEGKHIKILMNGVPMIGRSDGNLDLDRIQVQDIERIEIIENAMSVVYGTNALGGTINIITKKTKEETWNARVLGQIQSNQQYNTSLALGGRWKNFAADVNYNFSHFNGFSLDTFRSQTWNPKQQHAIGGRLNYNIPSTSISLTYQLNYLNEKIEDRGIIKLAAFPSLSYAKDYDFITITQDHSIAALGYLDTKKKYYLDALVAFNDYQRAKNAYFRSMNENPAPDQLDSIDSDTTSFQAWNIRLTLASQYHQKIDFKTGIDIRYDYTTGARIADNNARLGDFAAFVNLRYKPITPLNIDAGIRVAYSTMKLIPITYSIGLKWNIMDGMNLRFSYARGIRTPSLKELYLNFVDINHNIQGNPNLNPEYAHNLSLGWSHSKVYKGGHLANLEVNGFYNYIDQQIALFSYELDSLGNYVMNSQSNQYAYFNLDNYQNWGINSKIKYQHKGLTIQLGATLIGHYNSLNKDYSEQVKPFQYTLELSQEITYHFKKIDLMLSLFRRDYDKQIRYVALTNPMTQETEIVQNTMDGYGLMDFNVTKRFFKKALSITVGIKNILDVQVVNQLGTSTAHGGGSGSRSVAMGRIFVLRLICEPFRFRK
ncbi:TonB-dependent receptor plug domain-containing protein [Aureispira anguillae]|uniref:TonB-dependent receptor n=1 Tax=Aureispira anguillae TaxID=2864201 RepID=A0A915VJS3_9BACT|nr:TonB-dependent receptor [Aureispira anguillae]BDS09322.1 TonB-dependent receptor [Aureispira anguillae]